MDIFNFLFNPFISKILVFIMLALGILMGLAGYRFFKLIMGIAGFMGGFMLGMLLAARLGHSETLYLMMFGILVGILVSVLAVIIYFVGVFVLGAMIGAGVAMNLGNFFPIPHLGGLSLVLAIACGFIAIIFQRSMIIISSAAIGAWWTGVSVGSLLGWISNSEFITFLFPRNPDLFFCRPLIGWLSLILLIIGIVVQFSSFSRRD